ncbi:MAG TPA: DUF6122 family protein [Ferruginibacter sp.]|nr:DUF6122 family protein [Ferruginibacter sp.]
MLQFIVHYSFHFVFPLLLAFVFFKNRPWRTYFILIATMLVDLDHLWAIPVFDSCRCSIGFHPLHSYWTIGIYILLLFPKPTRLVAIGLLIHMAADGVDCLMMKC